MTDEQRADLDAGKRCVVFNADPDVPVGTIVDDTLPPAIAGIITQVKAVEDAEAAQQHDGGKSALNKADMKKAMGECLVKFSLRGEAKAESLGLTELETSLQHPLGYFADVDDTLSVTHSRDVRDILNLNKTPGGVLTNILAGDIVIIDAAIKAFTDVESTPVTNREVRKSDGTDKIQPEIDKMYVFIDREKKILHSYWDDVADNKKYVDRFDLASHPVVLGVRHNNVAVTLLKDEDGAALAGGTVTSVSNGKTNGGSGGNVYTIVGVQVGIKEFKAEAPGRVAVSFDVTVERRKTAGVTVRMKLI